VTRITRSVEGTGPGDVDILRKMVHGSTDSVDHLDHLHPPMDPSELDCTCQVEASGQLATTLAAKQKTQDVIVCSTQFNFKIFY